MLSQACLVVLTLTLSAVCAPVSNTKSESTTTASTFTVTAASTSITTASPTPSNPKIGDPCPIVGDICGITNDSTILWCGDSTGSAQTDITIGTTSPSITGQCGAAAGPNQPCSAGTSVCYPGMTCNPKTAKCDPPVNPIGGLCNAQWKFDFHVCDSTVAVCANVNPKSESNLCIERPEVLPSVPGECVSVEKSCGGKVGAVLCFGAVPTRGNGLSEASYYCKF
ncbi:hypothetical protein BDR26DRAFT_853729 [Obelidium mucronatum]|nr:hypothetical protein BDR26DRAFT_853729 [Obelidium mucronatum]